MLFLVQVSVKIAVKYGSVKNLFRTKFILHLPPLRCVHLREGMEWKNQGVSRG